MNETAVLMKPTKGYEWGYEWGYEGKHTTGNKRAGFMNWGIYELGWDGKSPRDMKGIGMEDPFGSISKQNDVQ